MQFETNNLLNHLVKKPKGLLIIYYLASFRGALQKLIYLQSESELT